MTLEDIAAMDCALIGTKEISEVTGTDRYTVNRMAAEGEVFGCKPYYVGRKGVWVKVARLEFLKNMGWNEQSDKLVGETEECPCIGLLRV